MRATTLPTSEAATGFALEQGGAPTGHGHRRRPAAFPRRLAAFVNGVLAHSLDYDDTHLPSILHPSASVVPAALATAQAHGRSGADLVPAVAVGLEVAVRLGMAGYDRDSGANAWFDRGQHATSICGTIGSAAAAAKLMGLDDAEIADAMAVAASMASGIIEANRTGRHGQATPLRMGRPGRGHRRGAHRPGPLGPPDRVRGTLRPARRIPRRRRARPEEVAAGLTDDPAANDWAVAGIFYKPYPANHYTHCGIDAAIQLRRGACAPRTSQSAHLGVASATVRTIGEPLEVKQAPETGYQAQFSGPLHGGRGAARRRRAGSRDSTTSPTTWWWTPHAGS